MMIGCAPEDLDAAASALDTLAERVRTGSAAAASLLSAHWEGHDAAAHRGRARNVMRRCGVTAGDIEALARSLRRQADEQRRTSEASGGAIAMLGEDGGTGSSASSSESGGSSVEVTRNGGWLTVTTGSGNDHVWVEVHPDGTATLHVRHLDADGNQVGEETTVDLDDLDRLVIRTGDGNDIVDVPPGYNVSLTVSMGAGNDIFGSSSSDGIPRVGSDGDDLIFLGDGDDIAMGGAGNDRIYGGGGDDMIDGQDGDDVIFLGAAGAAGLQAAYGGRGNDRITGGPGRDVLEGGSGDDVLVGGDGDDILSGGRGNDRLIGGDGDDVLSGGRGSDSFDPGAGTDLTYADNDVRTAAEKTVVVELDGAPGDYAIEIVRPDWMSEVEFDAFTERIDSDLELIRSLPSGRAGLEALDEAAASTQSSWNPFDTHRVVRIYPYGMADGPMTIVLEDKTRRPYEPGDWVTGRRLPGSVASSNDQVGYNTHGLSTNVDSRPPVASVYHELAHSWDALRGGWPDGKYTETFVDADGNVILTRTPPRSELNAVGFPTGTLEANDGTMHPEELTENALRGDLNWPDRPSYTSPPAGTDRVVIDPARVDD
jgi:hypothetical protein